jgi:hypothetical protein
MYIKDQESRSELGRSIVTMVQPAESLLRPEKGPESELRNEPCRQHLLCIRAREGAPS